MDTIPEWEVVEVLGRLPGASNATLLAHLDDGDLVVYKPIAGETPLWDFDDETLAIREVLAYEVSESAGLGVVPETRWATGPHGPGSAQRFVHEDRETDHRTLVAPPLDDRLWPIALLDLVTNNADRKLGHVLPTTEGDLLAIDNALSFHPDDKLRTVLWGFAGQAVPARWRPSLEALMGDLDDLAGRVRRSLGEAEAEAFASRVEWLWRHPVHPIPPRHRTTLPWPLW